MLEFTFEFSAITSEHSCSEAFLCPNTAFYGGIRADEIVPPWLATKPKNRIIFKAFALFWAEAFLHI